MAPPRYIYQRHGQPLLSWAGGPPSQTRAADAKSLGDYSHPDGNPMGLPRPGAPEFLGNYVAVGDVSAPSCPPGQYPEIVNYNYTGNCVQNTVLWGLLPVIPQDPTGGLLVYGLGALLLYKILRR